MGANPGQDRVVKSAINKQILELKKKIQLSDGQRKALFEDFETQRKGNADEIIRLKSENSRLAVELHESQMGWTKYLANAKRLTLIVGPLERKKYYEVQELLDLQIINQTKKVDLFNYRIKQRQKYLAELADEYQVLISDRARRQVTEKIDIPVKKTASELQNSIQAVRVQQREASHVRIRYRDIRKSLLEDAARFESNIRDVEEQLKAQNGDIQRLQQINTEACRLKGSARSILLQEERAALTSAREREKTAIEGKKLVEDHRHQLERLERRIFQVGKPEIRPDPQDQEHMEEVAPNSPDETPPDPREAILDSFEMLKQATGATSISEVLERFRAQKETLARLISLRKTTELEKHRMEDHRNNLQAELGKYKFAEAKDAAHNLHELERTNKLIEAQHAKRRLAEDTLQKIEEVAATVLTGIKGLHFSVEPNCSFDVDTNSDFILEHIEANLENVLNKLASEEGHLKFQISLDEDNWLPPPYASLVRRTPIPQAGASPIPPPPGSEDEEEVPSRAFLKRQAQLVIDAKTRRKNLRIHLPQRK